MARRPTGISFRTMETLGDVLYDIARHSQGKLAHQAITRKAGTAIEQHLPSLLRRREQLVRQDAYGKKVLKDWLKEIEYFITEYIEPLLTEREQFGFVASVQSEIADKIYRRVEEEREKIPLFQTFSENTTPIEFKTYCAGHLRRAGWDAHVTKQSRDQGVDVVAKKNGVRVVLQCKLFSRPVGNKAVQEAAAARAHEQADYGVVVSNQKFTKDAEQLASTNKIFLIHHTDLSRLSNIIRRSDGDDGGLGGDVPSGNGGGAGGVDVEDVTLEEFWKRVKDVELKAKQT
jgi:hypothetical protein